jgi:hypothetical protein
MYRRSKHGAEKARMKMRMKASLIRSPSSNQYLAYLFTATRTKDELTKRAIVSLKATETFILVSVSCFSFLEKALTANFIRKLITKIEAAEAPEMA